MISRSKPSRLTNSRRERPVRAAQRSKPSRLTNPTIGRNQQAFSTIEVVVTVAILGLVMTTVFQGFSSSQTALENTSSRLRNLDEARVLMAATSKDLRTAVRLQSGTSPFLVANGLTATFFANLDTTSAPKKVHIYVDVTSQLVEEVWNADVGSVAPNYTFSGAPHVRFVGRYVANTNAAPIFQYLDVNGGALNATPLNAADLLAVRAVKIVLQVKRATNAPIATTTLVNRVRLPNLDYNAVAG